MESWCACNKGMDRTRAAIEAATQPAMPLLGATVIAVMAFYPIFASDEGAGEYCASLFQVVAVSLMISWVLSVTITPLMCILVATGPGGHWRGRCLRGRFNRMFRGCLEQGHPLSIYRDCWADRITVAFLVRLPIHRPHLLSRFGEAAADGRVLGTGRDEDPNRLQRRSHESKTTCLSQDETCRERLGTFIGQGPPRFYLPVEPEMPYSSPTVS